MKLVVASCWKYRDAWPGFFGLLERFWPDHPETYLLTDAPETANPLDRVHLVRDSGQGLTSWGPRIADFARKQAEEILLMQEDFFLSAPVETEWLYYALGEMKIRGAGAVRVYPCPGADSNYGNDYVGIVSRGRAYRISCQATIWKPRFLALLALRGLTPTEFELQGTAYAEGMTTEVLSVKREAQPWPMQYLCSAISRGKWNPDAKKLCEAQGIEVDWSMRPMAST